MLTQPTTLDLIFAFAHQTFSPRIDGHTRRPLSQEIAVDRIYLQAERVNPLFEQVFVPVDGLGRSCSAQRPLVRALAARFRNQPGHLRHYTKVAG